MSVTPIRVGFVGLSTTGWASMALGPALLHPTLASKYRLTAVSTTSAASASASAEKHSTESRPVKAFHGDTSAIAKDPDVDFVIVAVRAPAHKEAILPVIAAGKDFFLEWPAGLNLEETTEIAQAAKEKAVKTIIGLQGRHTPVVCKIKELIDSGKIGKILSSSIIALAPREAGFWGPRVNERNEHTIDKDAGATILDIALGHELDIVTHILGDFASVSATCATIYPTATIFSATSDETRTAPVTAADHVAFSGLLKSGAVASVTWRGGYTSTPGRTQFLWTIDGEDGSIRVEEDAINGAFIHIRDPKLFLNGERVPTDENWGGFSGNIRAAWAEFADGGQDTKYATIEDAVKLKTLLQAIDLSARDGVRVGLN
ncbi:NAD-binding Rossmann fold oxidoreductase [Mycena maculata]|uniref:NAD-binding Rossmann fold oxidoreductase n=1 Tax=Mycena maculata TaxID=230809 RepID=A0AAD7N1N7_9AGAR|nr:NAD-binding Rossmann fold oxidoreductase [Mycena maculata]